MNGASARLARVCVVALFLFGLSACGASGPQVAHGTAHAGAASREQGGYDFSDDLVTGDLVRPDGELLSAGAPGADGPKRESAPLVAAAEPQEGAGAEVASDAVKAGPILVYTANFTLSVYEVEKAQGALKAAAKTLGGFVSLETNTLLTMRIPAAKFEEALQAVEGAGKVQRRQVQALDVGEEYRDLELRLHTAELIRARLEAMLARAERVPEALAVQTELERVVREIEQLKGRQRSLHDRIAYSTITVSFQPQARPDLDESDVFALPFPWLDQLGLHNLLELSR